MLTSLIFSRTNNLTATTINVKIRQHPEQREEKRGNNNCLFYSRSH